MTTKQAVADVPAPMMAGTLAVYLSTYVVLLTAYIGVLFYLARKAGDSPATTGAVRGVLRPGMGQKIPAE
jgi:cytochrome d ubiquinol oxidase subunit I